MKPARLCFDMNVFFLWHGHEQAGGAENSKLIGVYSSRELAEAALRRALPLPQFRDSPNGFILDRQQVNRDLWESDT
jgi:hypothetical protein